MGEKEIKVVSNISQCWMGLSSYDAISPSKVVPPIMELREVSPINGNRGCLGIYSEVERLGLFLTVIFTDSRMPKN